MSLPTLWSIMGGTWEEQILWSIMAMITQSLDKLLLTVKSKTMDILL